MEDGICTKKFPKEFSPHTVAVLNGYPLYRRVFNGRVVVIKSNKNDNRWLVPHNSVLPKKYHINFEACMTIKLVKYLNKHIYKNGQTCDKVSDYLKNSCFSHGNSMLHDEEPDHLFVCFLKLINILSKIYHLTNVSQTMLYLQMHLIYKRLLFYH